MLAECENIIQQNFGRSKVFPDEKSLLIKKLRDRILADEAQLEGLTFKLYNANKRINELEKANKILEKYAKN